MAEHINPGQPNLPVSIGRLDSSGMLLLIAGMIAVYQRFSEIAANIGYVGIALGTLILVGVMVLRRAPWQNIVERITVIGMFVGILGMLQHWEIVLYEYGFYLLLISTIGFIWILHVPVKDEGTDA